MTQKVKLTKGHNLGGLNLLPGTVLVSTDDLGPLEAIGVAVRVIDVQEAEVVQVREPKISFREPKVQKSKLA